MIRIRNYILFLILLMLTILYCIFIYLGMGFYKVLLESQGIKELSNFTVITSSSPTLWQIMAFISLGANSIFAFFLSKRHGDSQAFVATTALHISWLLICFFLHGIGCLFPFLMWVPVLK
ncbi:hypothetical protein H8E88_18940 [candidate division KSB1 bacterium]|nr:hypothetical protein [candidate division KSB1 bacterium]